jgi:Leucine-rich repeat (LRR) protein
MQSVIALIVLLGHCFLSSAAFETTDATSKPTSITPNTLNVAASKCPNNCMCANASVYCESTGLTEVPALSQLPENVRLLDLRQNRLQRLAIGDVLTQLTSLSLAHNLIDDIESNALTHYPSLIELDLSFNKLDQLPERLFATLPTLKVLRLQQNRIKTLPDHIFKPLIHLQSLDLSGNPLEFVFDSWFKSQRELKTLDLSSCRLSELPHALFHRTDQLEQIDLSDNDFQTVPLLKSATNLKRLILNENPWLRLGSQSFPNLLKLEDLQINDCPNMSQIDEFTFTDLRSLRILSMSRNPHLIYIDPFAFTGLFNESYLGLEELIMHENTLTIIDERTLPFDRLKRLDLRANPFNCDCAIAWARLLTNRFEEVRTAR